MNALLHLLPKEHTWLLARHEDIWEEYQDIPDITMVPDRSQGNIY